MSQSSRRSLTYLRFINLAQAIRQLPSFPTMDAVEERLLNLFAAAWYDERKITVVEAMGMATDISATTAHRRLKTLRKKGLIELVMDEDDNRIKYVLPTEVSYKYFAQLGQCLDQAKAA